MSLAKGRENLPEVDATDIGLETTTATGLDELPHPAIEAIITAANVILIRIASHSEKGLNPMTEIAKTHLAVFKCLDALSQDSHHIQNALQQLLMLHGKLS